VVGAGPEKGWEGNELESRGIAGIRGYFSELARVGVKVVRVYD
jgi:hypothetical protein